MPEEGPGSESTKLINEALASEPRATAHPGYSLGCPACHPHQEVLHAETPTEGCGWASGPKPKEQRRGWGAREKELNSLPLIILFFFFICLMSYFNFLLFEKEIVQSFYNFAKCINFGFILVITIDSMLRRMLVQHTT